MDFSLSADQEALRDGVRSFCDATFGIAQLRDLEERGLDRALWGQIAEMGILGLRVPEEQGGVGLGMAEAVLVFEELGRCVAPGPLIWSHLAADLLPEAGTGELIVTGLDLRGRPAGPYSVDWLELSDRLLVLDDEGLRLIDTAEIDARPLARPLDPFSPMSRVERLPAGERVADVDAARTFATRGAALVAASMLGIAEAAQALATDYARERQQFDRAIGSFQAVKHILADCFARQEVARAATWAAGVLLDDGDPEEADVSVSAASLIAEEAAMKNARACIQVHGGMGFTWENASHYYLKRVWVLQNALRGQADRAEALALHVAAAA